jgi:tetratricopeptide (TPR) repeat protein
MNAFILNWALFSAFYAFSAFAFGQSTTTSVPVTPPPAAKSVTISASATPDYSGESSVVEHFNSVYQMAADGTGWHQMAMAVRIQSDAALKQLGVLVIPYAGSSDRVEIAYARVRHADGTVVETPVADAMDLPEQVTREAPFYSDLKQKQLPIRSLRVGDTLEWEAKIVRTRAEVPGQFWGQENFNENIVTLSESLELRVPKDTYVNVWSPKSKPVDTVVGGEHVFRWEFSQKKATVGKEADAANELKKKQVWTADQELDDAQGKLPSVAWTTFKSWEAVGAWYQRLETDRIIPDAEVKAKVAELTAGKATEEEKVRAVYGYVATQIRYIGVAFGVGRYQPHHANEVLQNQYGDCKDKHTLLAAMLGVLSVRTDAVLIGAGVRFNETVPSPAAFNHLITLAHVNGQDVWLDTTAEVAPYRMLMYVLRDRNALVVPNSGVAQIEKTPAKPPFEPFAKMNAAGTLDREGTSNSRLEFAVRGDAELVLRAAFRQIPPARYDQAVQRMSLGIGYAGTTSHPEVSRPEDTGEPFKMSYDYKREKAGDWDNYKIIPQLMPVSLPRLDEKEPPVRAIELGAPGVEISTASMKLPDGWGVELPEAVHAKSAYATYDETYRFDKGTLYTERRVEVLQEKVPVADWKSYKKFADKVDLGNETYVQLVRNEDKTKAGVADEKGPVAPKSAEAANLVLSAQRELQQHHLDAAQSMLDEAKLSNDKQAWLWSEYGYLATQRGEMTAALKDYEKEVSLHPEEYGAYQYLSQAQINFGHRKEGEETLKKWAAVDENNPRPSAILINMLIEDKNATGAMEVAEAAIARLPEDKKKDEYLHLALGRAQLMAGKKDAGCATLLALMQKTEDPGMMNNAAYELANAGQALEQTEKAARAALKEMDEASNAWTLDENPEMLIGKSNLIVATWDTVGWILYREGKVDEAQDYVRAAWRNTQHAEVGGHVGELLAAKGDKDGALTAYQFALVTAAQYDALGVRKAPGEVELKLTAKVEELRKAGAKSSVSDPHTAVQKLRVISLGPAKGMDGTAGYRLLLSEGKVERVEATGTKVMVGGPERLKTANLSGFWPAGSHAKLVRNGMLNCHSGVCELVLVP